MTKFVSDFRKRKNLEILELNRAIREDVHQKGANEREKVAKEIATKDGYEVLRNGWPDFLLYRVSDNKVVFLEVKAKSGTGKRLSIAQQKMKEVLTKLGFVYQIVYIK